MFLFLYVCVFLEEDVELPDVDYLRTMTHIVFVDFDNWSNFFGHLPGHLNQGTFIWGFQGMVEKGCVVRLLFCEHDSFEKVL